MDPETDTTGSRFGRLRTKLFLAIAGANALLAAVAYLVFSASFDRGLAETLGRATRRGSRRSRSPSPRATARERGWGWITDDRERWTELSREALGLPAAARRGGRSLPQRRSPRPTRASCR